MHAAAGDARFSAAGLTPPAVVITADLTPRGKPYPDPYLAGAAALGVAPEDCLVIEDAPAGIAAGLAAGATVWAVTTTHAAAELSAAHAVFSGLPEIVGRSGGASELRLGRAAGRPAAAVCRDGRSRLPQCPQFVNRAARGCRSRTCRRP